MANTNKVIENFRATNGLNHADLNALLAFKKELSEGISESPKILEGRLAEEIMYADPLKSAASDPLDYSFLNILGRYVLDDSEGSPLHEQEELYKSFNELPQNLQNMIKAQIAIFSDVKSYSEEQRIQQIETLKLAEKVLSTSDGEPSFGDDKRLDINENTSRALRNYLDEMETTGKIEQKFEPRIFDDNSKEALDELVGTLAEELDVESYEINDLMIHIYDNNSLFDGASAEDKAQIEALGKAVVMRDLMNMIVEGHTPSSESAKGHKADAEINWDKPWANHFSGDKFFGRGVYKTLYKEQDTWGEIHLTTGVLFRGRDYSDEQYDILTKAAKETLGITPDGPNREISEIEVGKIAIEIMKIRAEQVWCMEHPGEEFDPKQIHAMIHNKEFMPHLSDLKFVDAGLGVPPEFELTADKLGVNSFKLQYEYEYEVRMHRIAEFQENFGDLPQNAIESREELYKGKGAYMDSSGNIDMNEVHASIQSTAGTPAYYYRPLGRAVLNPLSQYRVGNDPALSYMTPTQYEIDRQEYLERAQTIIEDGGCNAEAKLAVEFNDVGKDAGKTPDDCINAAKGDCNIFDQLKAKGREAFLIDGDLNNTTVGEDKAAKNLENMSTGTP